MPSRPPSAPYVFSTASDSDQDSLDVFEDDESSRPSKRTRAGLKKPGACVDCKSVKVRCEPVPGERKCRRCQSKNLPCTPRERKKRKSADTHEELQEKAHNQDLQIRQLLLQYDQLKADYKIRQWVTKSHPQTSPHLYDRRSECYQWLQSGTSPEDAAGIYFGLNDRALVPDLVKHCGLYPEEIVHLFTLFFEHINPFFSILDETLHTPNHLIRSSPFLFTVVCATSSRYYTARPDVYNLAMDFARDAAGKGLIEGKQSVDTCQAYLLMSVYPVPTKKWVEDRSWLLMGVAIRMAMELKLNQPPPDGLPEREKLNRVRTWLNCYCADGSHAIQFGKMPMLRLDDYLARSSTLWYRSSSLNSPLDVHLVAYVHILLIMAQWRTEITEQAKIQTTEDSAKIATALRTHARLSKEMDRWRRIYDEEFSYNPLPICSYRGQTTQMIAAYLKLVVLSQAFGVAFKSQGLSRDSEMLRCSLDAARSVIQIMVERMAPTGHLRYAMGSNFLYVSFAAAFLINLLRPKFGPLLNEPEKGEVVGTVSNLINVLGSPDICIDGKHAPALYSRFLSTLLRQHCPKPLLDACTSSNAFSGGSPSGSDGYDRGGSDYGSSWPDVSGASGGHSSGGSDLSSGMVYHQHGDPAMDFSLNHFVKTVTNQNFSARAMVPDVQFMGPIQAPQMDGWRGWQEPDHLAFTQLSHLTTMPLGNVWRA